MERCAQRAGRTHHDAHGHPVLFDALGLLEDPAGESGYSAGPSPRSCTDAAWSGCEALWRRPSELQSRGSDSCSRGRNRDDSSEDDKESASCRLERKRQNARDASKRYRERRREHATVLTKRNRALEKEIELLRVRSADLRAELHALRIAGSPDLEKENALIRLEVKRHKRFIERVAVEARNPEMSEMSPEERYRLVQGALESGKLQMLALAYASASPSSRTWRTSSTRMAKTPGASATMPGIAFRYQYRPVGLPRCQATSLNLRVDIETSLPISCEEYLRQRGFPAVGVQRTGYGSQVVTEDVTPPEFRKLAEKLGEDEGIRIFYQRETLETGEVVTDIHFAVMLSSVDVCLPAVFPYLSEKAMLAPDYMARALVRCVSDLDVSADGLRPRLASEESLHSALGAGPVEAASDVQRMAMAHYTFGLVGAADPTDPEGSSWLMNVNSDPYGPNMYGMPIRDVFDDEGIMHPQAVAEVSRISRQLLDFLESQPPRVWPGHQSLELASEKL